MQFGTLFHFDQFKKKKNLTKIIYVKKGLDYRDMKSRKIKDIINVVDAKCK